MIPGPGYSSVRSVKYLRSKRLLTPNCAFSFADKRSDPDQSVIAYAGISPMTESSPRTVLFASENERAV